LLVVAVPNKNKRAKKCFLFLTKSEARTSLRLTRICNLNPLRKLEVRFAKLKIVQNVDKTRGDSNGEIIPPYVTGNAS
jgi:hypothetical protein